MRISLNQAAKMRFYFYFVVAFSTILSCKEENVVNIPSPFVTVEDVEIVLGDSINLTASTNYPDSVTWAIVKQPKNSKSKIQTVSSGPIIIPDIPGKYKIAATVKKKFKNSFGYFERRGVRRNFCRK